MTFAQVLDLISKVGLGGLLVAILYGSYKRIWVWGSEMKRVEAERDEWKDLALSGTHVADALSDFAVRERLGEQAASLRRERRQAIAKQAHTPLARPRREP